MINYEEKEMIPLTDNENNFYNEQEEWRICKKEFCYDKNEKKKFKLYQIVREFFFYNNDTRKVKINLKDIQQSPNYNILYNQGKIKIKVIILKYMLIRN